MIHRILLLDADTPLRTELAEMVGKMKNTEVIFAESANDLVLRVRFGSFHAVFADRDLLLDELVPLTEAVRTAVVRPLLVIATNVKTEDLHPDYITLLVRKPYDAQMVAGVLLSVIPPPASGSSAVEDAWSTS